MWSLLSGRRYFAIRSVSLLLPPSTPRLRVNVSWTLVGNAWYAGSQWLTLIVIAQLGSPKMVGQYALALAVVSPLVMFANLGLRSLQATDAGVQHGFSTYLRLRSTTALIALALTIALVGLIPSLSEAAGVIVAIALAKAFESVSDIAYGAFQQAERMSLVARSLVIRGTVGLVTLSALLAMTGNLALACAGVALAWAAAALLHDIPTVARLPGPAKAELLSGFTRYRDLLSLAWPLAFAALFISLTPNVPRYFIEGSLGTAALGVYAASAYLVVAGGMVVNALGQSVGPRLARLAWSNDVQAFRRLHRRLLSIVALVGLGAFLISLIAGEWLLTALYGPEYGDRADVLIGFMAFSGAIYAASVYGYTLTALRLVRSQPLLFGTSVGLVTVLSAALIPRFGLLGAVTAYGVTLMSQAIAGAALTERRLRQLSKPKSRDGDL